MTINLTNKQSFTFEEFPIQEKNYRKVRLHNKGEDSEGVWAAFSDEGVKLHDSNISGQLVPFILLNDALNFYPRQSWGLYLVAELKGCDRPSCDLSTIDFSNYPLFCQEQIDAAAATKE